METEAQRRFREKRKDTPEVKEAAKKRARAWRDRMTDEERKAYQRAAGARFYANHKARVAVDRLVRVYGVDRAAAEAAALTGACEICNTPSALGSGRTGGVVDHAHDSNRVRGFLCAACNKALGFMADDPARLRAAADYLDRAAAKL